MKRALVIIDMQQIFRDTSSQWCVPEYDSAAEKINRLVEGFDGKVIWTRFVRDPEELGSWKGYYSRWDECRDEPDSPVWDITMEVRPEDEVLSLPTFSKWGEELNAISDAADELVICGVATDCCVLSTALGAVDAGKSVVIVEDACAGATLQAHDQAIALLQMLEPMTSIKQTADLVQ